MTLDPGTPLSTFYKTGESHDEIGASEDRDKLHQNSRFWTKMTLKRL